MPTSFEAAGRRRLRPTPFVLSLLLLVLAAGCRGPHSGPQRRTLTVGDAQLYLERSGTGPALVFLHGGQMDARLWDDQVRRFAARYTVVRYDIRGYGRSSDVLGPYASHEDLERVLNALDLERVVLVGHSLGGRIAIDYALDHPERVAGLVLVAPGVTGWDWSGPDHAFFEDILAAAEAGDSAGAVELWLASPYMAPAMESPTLAARLRQLCRANERAWRMPDVERRREPPAVNQLEALTMPTLLVVGSRDVPDILRIADLLESTLPDVERVDLTGVGHVPNLEAAERFDRELTEFLAERRGRNVSRPTTRDH